jgi:glyoxylase-like metal-dependent hydrolase (beta-lactamase superfamily II)
VAWMPACAGMTAQQRCNLGPYIHSFQLGAARVTVIDTGVAAYPIPKSDDVSDEEWQTRTRGTFDVPVPFCQNVVHIALPDTSILVDVGWDDLGPHSPFQPPRFERRANLVTSLAEAGVQPEDITHVIITHAHDDHFAGATVQRDGEWAPRFRNARYLLSRLDWEGNPDRGNSDEVCSYTLDVLDRLGQLDLVDGDLDLMPEVRIIAAPGETPGHQIVCVQSNGETLYAIGDLYHVPLMVEYPFTPKGRDAAAVRASRQALTTAALTENALLVAGHIEGIGRLEVTPQGLTWCTVGT